MKFKLPKAFITQLKEFSNKGYCLFIINVEGEIEVHHFFENETAASSIISKMSNVSNAMAFVLQKNEIENILGEDED